jgi:uncharacterized surface protein with fasciclin (FAS1) repeats
MIAKLSHCPGFSEPIILSDILIGLPNLKRHADAQAGFSGGRNEIETILYPSNFNTIMYLSFLSKSRMAFAALSMMFALASCQKDQLEPVGAGTDLLTEDRSTQTVAQVASSIPDFSALVAAASKTGLVPTLNFSGLNATVFAPTNAAFAQLPAPFNNAANINAISDPATINTLRGILQYHLIAGRRNAAQLPSINPYATLKPQGVPFDRFIFATLHSNGNIFINGNSRIVTANVMASNGTIQVIDRVLLPPTQNIAEIAIGNGNFSALVAALQKTNLVNTVTTSSTRTVFAPTDAAFAQLPAPFNNAANISNIFDAGQVQTLRNILMYHICSPRIFAVGLQEGQKPATLLGGNQRPTISLVGGPKIKGNGNPVAANIVTADIFGTTGNIHVIDRVLLP